ncbi:MAG: hypothetical protein FWG45_01300 [Oscillospiraceae bacterium]|nr:hypothetical protein [Oscillospiraceae bacterium]
MLTTQKRKFKVPSALITAVVFSAVTLFVIVMLNNAATTTDKEAIAALEESIVRATVSCYAFEGVYPDNLDYLIENYNLVIDEERFFVHYEKSMDNIMPIIIVRAMEPQGGETA